MESLSFSSPLVDEKEKKNELPYICVCEYISLPLEYSMKVI
jgi:hypothetical protein